MKINDIKQIISFHEFDFYLDRGEEVLWLEECKDSKKSKDVVTLVEQPKYDHFQHILLEEHNRQVFNLREKVSSLRQQLKDQSYDSDKLKQEIAILKKELFSCNVDERIPEVELRVKKSHSKQEYIHLRKLEIKKSLRENFSYDSMHFGLVDVKILFPQIKDQPEIPKYLINEMIDIYTRVGLKIINKKVKQAFRSKKNRDRQTGKIITTEVDTKEEDLKKHFIETMKYVGIEFIPVPHLPKVHFSSQS